MTVYAKFENKSAALSGDFGKEFLARRFGAEAAALILAHFGTFSRGPRKGLHRGYINWIKCHSGGWHRDGHKSGVMRPGVSNVSVSLKNNAFEGGLTLGERDSFASVTDAEWLWRVADTLAAMTGKPVADADTIKAAADIAAATVRTANIAAMQAELAEITAGRV